MLPLAPIVDSAGRVASSWLQWFSRTEQTIEAQRAVGETTERPTPDRAYVGMQFFDTTLGYPIWASDVQSSGNGGVTWVDAAGSTV